MKKGKIFNGQEVQAIIAGDKRMFREVIKPYPVLSDDKSYWEYKGVRWAGEKSSYAKNFGDNARPEIPDLCHYELGQKIFCKESFAYIQDPVDCAREGEPCEIHYKADYDAEGLDSQDAKNIGVEFLPASQMPQWASRLTLQIEEIRVERLADISEEDAIAEGVIYPNTPVCCHRYQTHCCGNYEAEDASWEFKQIWNTTHEKPEEKWEADPWVFVYSFEVVK